MEAKDSFLRAERGDVDFFKTVAAEILLNARDEDDYTVLTVAALNGRLDCCEVIVERCTQLLYHQDKYAKWSVLHNVAAYVWDNVENILGFLITADSKPDLELGRGRKIPNNRLLATQTIFGGTALHLAVGNRNHGATKLLLEADCDFELLRMVDVEGRTCLHIVADKGDHVSAELIINASPDNEFLMMTDTTILKQTALHIAVQEISPAIVQLLLEADLSNDLLAVVDSRQRTALHYAVEQGNLDMVKLMCKAGLEKQLLSMPDEDKNTPLHVAVRNSNLAIVQLLLEADHSNDLLAMVDSNQQTALHIAVENGNFEMVKLMYKAGLDKQLLSMPDYQGNTPLHLAMVQAAAHYGPGSDSKIICSLLEMDPNQCTKLQDEHEQPFIHVAVKLGLIDVVKTILKSKETEATILNIQDKDGNTPLHIAGLGQIKHMVLCLLYDARVSKEIENNKKEKAIDLINVRYDEAKARVYSLGHQSDLKDQTNFLLLAAALIATVSFTAGITVPGGYVSDGDNKGSAILLKATAFKVFVISNNFALLLSLYTVFLNISTCHLLTEDDIYYESKSGTFRTRLLLNKKDVIYQFNAATLCTLSAVYAMVVAFITGSYAVLANSDGLAITVCISSSFFLILESRVTWTMAMQYWHLKPVPELSS